MPCWRAARGLPCCEGEAVKLQIPDIRQRADYDCGAAALDAVCQFHGLRRRGPSALANAVQGMSPDTVEAVLRSLGLSVLSGAMTLADLRHLTQTGRPVLCPITADAGGHWVVVAGVGYGRVSYHCPTHGPTKLPVAEWCLRWRDTSRAGMEFRKWGICASRE